MGGCKCAFYNCKNNTMMAKETNSIHSHFFHFPVKDEKRVVEWAIYSNNMHFLKLPVEKLKNKVICDKHFAETSFMNYTRSKLTKTSSIPIIYFDDDDQERDLLESPTEWVLENRKNKPAPGFLSNVAPLKPKLEIDESSQQITILNTSVARKPIESLKRTRNEVKTDGVKSTEVRILNKIPSTTISLNNQVHSLGEIKQIVKKSPPQAIKKILSPPEKVRIVASSSSTPKVLKNEIIQPIPLTPIEDQQIEFMYLNEEIPSPIKQAPDCSQEINSLVKDVAEIKAMLTEKLNQPQAQTSSTIASESSNITQSQFNKVQLFNGIKRYLSPSLIALLRMEIFAAPNREYKKDEKIICSEVLKLGSEVYDFFNDEWRLRLPSKEIVKGWQSEELTDDDAS